MSSRVSLSFDEHARLMRTFRRGVTPNCPKCNGDFEVRYPGGALSAVCLNCGLTVRDLPASVGVGAF